MTNDSHPHVCECEKICTCSCAPSWRVEICVANKHYLWQLLHQYEKDFLQEAWFDDFEILCWHKGIYISPRLIREITSLYPDQDREVDEGYAMHHVCVAYTVYAMQYGLWQFSCMGFWKLSDLEQMSMLVNPEQAHKFVSEYKGSPQEHHIIDFLHVWHFHPEALYAKSSKWVISLFKCGCRFRLLRWILS